MSEPAALAEAAARLAVLRACGAGGRSALRLGFAEALLRHAGPSQGRARQLLERRLDEVLSDLESCVPDADAMTLPGRRTLTGAAMLREFVVHLSAGEDPPEVAEVAINTPLPITEFAGHESGISTEDGIAGGVPMEPKSLRHFRRAWSRLAGEQRLQEAMADLPENAGPLNAHLLLHRALQQMNYISPDYLGRFLPYAETLLLLETSRSSGGLAKR